MNEKEMKARLTKYKATAEKRKKMYGKSEVKKEQKENEQ